MFTKNVPLFFLDLKFIFILCAQVFAFSLPLHWICAVPEEAREGCWIL